MLGAQAPASLRDLPLAEARAARGTGRLAVVMSGDGGWIEFDKDLAARLAQQGVSVVGFDSRAFLRTRRTPDQAAQAIGRVLGYYTRAWSVTRVTLIGYSRGADMAPFILNRLPAGQRALVDQLVLIGLAANANFEFHWEDLVRDIKRPDDLPTRPEVDKFLGALPVLCFYGDGDSADTCREYPETATWRAIRHGDGHRVTDAAPLVREILAALPGGRP